MSRFRRFAHSLISGYVLLGANIFYTLGSVPLALKYLSKSEFGLWALTSAIAQYIALIDFGMTGTSRILIDYKDERDAGNYGSVIQTFVLVSVAQGLVIVVVGVGLAFGLVPLLHIPSEQEHQFFLLTAAQSGLLAFTFLPRVLNFILAAHQRNDLLNYSQSIMLGLNFCITWLAFTKRQGVYSNLWGQFASVGALAGCYGFCAYWLKLFPAKGCWGKPAWNRFWDLFRYGRDVFLYVLGTQLINASQTLLLTRVLGLDAAAVWSVCTRAYAVVTLLIFRIFDYAAPAIAEMIVRNEKELLLRRFNSLVLFSVSGSVLAGSIFAVCNQPFVHFWTSGRISWPSLNDALLAVWMVLQAPARCHLGLVGQAKQFGFMRYLPSLEGAFFLVVSLLVLRSGGVSAMLMASIVGSLLFSTPYGMWRSGKYFHLTWKFAFIRWWLPPVRLAVALIPIGLLTRWLLRSLPALPQAIIAGAIIGMLGLVLLLLIGFDESLRAELSSRFPQRLRPLLQRRPAKLSPS